MKIKGYLGGEVETDNEEYRTGVIHGIMTQGISGGEGSFNNSLEDMFEHGGLIRVDYNPPFPKVETIKLKGVKNPKWTTGTSQWVAKEEDFIEFMNQLLSPFEGSVKSYDGNNKKVLVYPLPTGHSFCLMYEVTNGYYVEGSYNCFIDFIYGANYTKMNTGGNMFSFNSESTNMTVINNLECEWTYQKCKINDMMFAIYYGEDNTHFSTDGSGSGVHEVAYFNIIIKDKFYCYSTGKPFGYPGLYIRENSQDLLITSSSDSYNKAKPQANPNVGGKLSALLPNIKSPEAEGLNLTTMGLNLSDADDKRFGRLFVTRPGLRNYYRSYILQISDYNKTQNLYAIELEETLTSYSTPPSVIYPLTSPNEDATKTETKTETKS